MDKGWIKLHRKLMDKAIWQSSTPQQKVILITLLTMANHKEKEWEWKGKKFVAKPGQFVTSLQSIVDRAGKGITIQNVRTALGKFERYGFLTNKSTKTGRLITIVNWGFYQSDKKETNKDNNKGLTKDQQSTNKELTPNKNDKNDKNDKKSSSTKNPADILLDNELKKLQEIYQKCGFRVNALTRDWLLDLKKLYGFKWSKNALLVAEKRGKLSKRYVEGILENWHNDGGMKLGGEENGENKRSDKGDFEQYEDIGITI